MGRRTMGGLALAMIGLVCVSATATAAGRSVPRAQAELPALTAPRHPDALSRALSAGRISEAHAALYRAQALFQPQVVERRLGEVARPGARDATLILRDLYLRLDDLSGQERQQANAILARPNDDPAGFPGRWTTAEAGKSCGPQVCVHWTNGGGDQPAATDTNPANGVPDWVDFTLDTVEGTVWPSEVGGMGYRAPQSDLDSTNNGGDGKLDIYISDVGADGLYGYCTSDDPDLSAWDVSAYCVVDNDYRVGQFPINTPQENMQVTLAHEFFHAVQFTYDIGEDRWLMEGTATWMEEQVYDAINDNRQYLVDSQLRRPGIPLDRATGCCSQYGTWIWWEYLTQRLADPTYIRDVWERADRAAGGPNQYSLQAARTALAAHGLNIKTVYGDFAAGNRTPATTYPEGAAGRYPSPQSKASYTLSPTKASTGTVTAKLNHLTSVYYGLKPGSAVGPNKHVTVHIDAPALSTGPEARALVFRKGVGVTVKPFVLNSAGDGQLRLGFGRGTVTRVVIVMSNATQRYQCNRGTSFSCQGKSLDDQRPYAFRASLS